MDSLYIKAKGIYYVRAKGCTLAGQMDLVYVKAKGFILCQGKRDLFSVRAKGTQTQTQIEFILSNTFT